MDISYLGHSSFKIKGKEGTVVTDPFDPKMVGIPWNTTKADIVTISHDHQDHNYVQGVKPANGREEKGFLQISAPGEYESSGIMVEGWSSFHDLNQGQERGKNVIYLIELERIRVLHCGDLGHELDEALVDEIGQVDILLIPVGGKFTIDAKVAAKITKNISPSYVIPMHYQVPGMNPEGFSELSDASQFLREMGVGETAPVEKLSTSASTLPDDTQVVVLKV